MAPRGMTLAELMMAVAIFGVLTAMSLTAIGPLEKKYRTRQGAEVVAQALVEAQARASASQRCHRVGVSVDGGVAPPGTAGTGLVIEARPDANCELSPDQGAWVSAASFPMPRGIPVQVDAASLNPEFRPTSRIRTGEQATVHVGAEGNERLVLAAPAGAICVTTATPARCP